MRKVERNSGLPVYELPIEDSLKSGYPISVVVCLPGFNDVFRESLL